MNAVLAVIVIGSIAVAAWIIQWAGTIGNSGCGIFC